MANLIPKLFYRYLFNRFLLVIVLTFLVVLTLIYVLDFVELIRISSGFENTSIVSLLYLSLLRVPPVAEQAFPFAALFGALIVFLSLSRLRELVVARAAGISIWQILIPPLFVALLLGVFSTIVYNPVSATLKNQIEEAEAKLLRNNKPVDKSEFWLRQSSADGDAIIRAVRTNNRTASLANVTFFEFDPQGRFVQRIKADKALLLDGYWRLENARVLTPGALPEMHSVFEVATNVTPDLLRQTFTVPDAVPFWILKNWADQMKSAGIDATAFYQAYQSLLAKPLVFIAMVFIAACVSVRFSRTGQSAMAILGGVVSGFVFFTINKIFSDLGSAGLISTILAAWLPPGIACFLGCWTLLYQEDG